MARGRTARDAPPREILPLFARYLQECGFADAVRRLPLPQSSVADLESWVLRQTASVLFQLYLHPSLAVPGFAVERGSPPAQVALARRLHRACAQRLLEMGWVIKDVTGIHHLAPAVASRFDECANAIAK
jgi:ribosomal protein S19E (S16A)